MESIVAMVFTAKAKAPPDPSIFSIRSVSKNLPCAFRGSRNFGPSNHGCPASEDVVLPQAEEE